jgi:hypothetical protein
MSCGNDESKTTGDEAVASTLAVRSGNNESGAEMRTVNEFERITASDDQRIAVKKLE